MSNFCNKLRVLRKERKLTQKELSDLLGLSINSYSQYELGNTEPKYDNLIKLADFFCVSIDYLVGNSTITENPNTIKKISSEELTAEEIKMIKKIRLLGPYEQTYIKAQIDALSDTQKSKQKEKSNL